MVKVSVIVAVAVRNGIADSTKDHSDSVFPATMQSELSHVVSDEHG